MELVHETKIVTLDIECYLGDHNQFIAYACGFTGNKQIKLYYLTDYKNNYDMLYHCIYDVLKIYNNYTVYVHNFSHFDSYFILDMLKEPKGDLIKNGSFL